MFLAKIFNRALYLGTRSNGSFYSTTAATATTTSAKTSHNPLEEFLRFKEVKKRTNQIFMLLRDEEGRKSGLKIDEKKAKEVSSSEKGETSALSSHEGATSENQGQLTGVYELVSVLTYKGRSADLGHYVAWVKHENGV